jgi:hypothetical protein
MARPNPTIDDYIKNMLDAWAVLDEAKGLVRLQMASVQRFKQEHSANSSDTMTADYALRMFEKDEQLLYLMGNEVDCARALESMPRDKWSAYYKDNVLPIKEKEKQAGKEWAAIAKEAQDKGVQWPDYVTKGAKILE